MNDQPAISKEKRYKSSKQVQTERSLYARNI